MAKYLGNGEALDAYKIAKIGKTLSSGTELLLEDGTSVVASCVVTARCQPESGDYWVIRHDGYIYISKKEAFERDHKPYWKH